MCFPESLYTIDVLFVVFVIFFAVMGARHGLSGELAHVVTLIALLVGVGYFYPQLTRLASDCWRALPESAVRILVPVVLLLAAVLLFVLMRALLKQVFKNMGETADKAAGATVGIFRGILLGLTVLAGFSLIPNETVYRAVSEKSAIGAWACDHITPWAQSHAGDLPVLKNKAADRFEDLTQ